jgi:peptidoglycan/LPS O-acetylase OafA/YrhL
VIGSFVIWRQTWLTHALTSRPLLWLGKNSYSIYMVHFFVLVQVSAVLRAVFHVPVVDRVYQMGLAAGLAVTVGSIAIILILASQTYRFIEEPGRLFGRRLLKGDRNPRPLGSAAPSPGASK